jgi:hypothetical protein
MIRKAPLHHLRCQRGIDAFLHAAALRVACYNPKNRRDRKESERFKSFTYEELIKRDP